MFLPHMIPPIVYTDPWNQPFAKRFRMLTQGKTRIAYFYENADNSTFRYRIYNMAQVLNETPEEVSASYFFISDLAHLNAIADAADVLVICRARYDNHINHLLAAFKNRGKKILFDVDDLVFDLKWAQLLMTSLNRDTADPHHWNEWFAYISRIGATLLQCDGAITTNAYLARHIESFAQIPTAIVPNFMNQEQLTVSDQIFDLKKDNILSNESNIHIGYFSGSPSHAKDFALITSALDTLMEENERLCLSVVGYIEADDFLKKFGAHRVKTYFFCDYLNLQRLVGSVQFNVVPLQYNTFTNCKSELKYFEAAVVGTQTIASPTFTYANAIRSGDNGYLAQAHQWEHMIRQALADLPHYPQMAARAREDALLHYAWYHQRPAIMTALGLS